MSIDISEISPAPWESAGRRDADRAHLYRAAFQHRTELLAHYPWVPIPQTSGAFTFGKHERPFPVAALIRLWEAWPMFRGACPECKAAGLGISVGGFLSSGSVGAVCTRCDLVLSRWIGGITRIRSGVEPLLKDTPFFLRGGWGVGIYGPPGALIAVLQELGATDLPDAGSPSFAGGGTDSEDVEESEIKTRSSRGARARAGLSSAAPKGPRRYVVKEVVSSPVWSGAIWAVGCSSRESAERALKERVARNIAERNEQGAVMAFDREIGRLICWSDEVTNPQAAVKWWFK